MEDDLRKAQEEAQQALEKALNQQKELGATLELLSRVLEAQQEIIKRQAQELIDRTK